MINVSLPSALRIWSELEAAYYGDNKYGGTVAEIYAHTIKPLSNAAMLHFGDRNGGMKSTIGKESFEEEGTENREALMELIHFLRRFMSARSQSKREISSLSTAAMYISTPRTQLS
jgi:hypothetical protein